jgi:hypothetical protein
LSASPLVSILQALLVAHWSEWHATHPEQFELTKAEVIEQVEEGLQNKSLSSD